MTITALVTVLLIQHYLVGGEEGRREEEEKEKKDEKEEERNTYKVMQRIIPKSNAEAQKFESHPQLFSYFRAFTAALTCTQLS